MIILNTLNFFNNVRYSGGFYYCHSLSVYEAAPQPAVLASESQLFATQTAGSSLLALYPLAYAAARLKCYTTCRSILCPVINTRTL